MKTSVDDFEMRDEYDFTNGVRGVYIQRFEDLHLVSVAPELREAFPDSDAVNAALRELIESRKDQTEKRVELLRVS